MVDSHAHLGLCETADAELVASAGAVGVTRILTVGLDEPSNRAAVDAAAAHEAVFACVGRHPNSATGFDEHAAAELEELAAEDGIVAIGETGLDYFRDRATPAEQRSAFESQIAIAHLTGLPLVIHIRDRGGGEAVADAFSMLASEAAGLSVVLHCFSASSERVEEAAERGWYCSFAGNLTYPKSDALRDAARLVPDQLLLVETDSPFLAPQSLRGKPNEPANVVEVAERLAEERGISYTELEALVDANAARVFEW